MHPEVYLLLTTNRARLINFITFAVRGLPTLKRMGPLPPQPKLVPIRVGPEEYV